MRGNGRKSNCLSPKGEFWICSEANFRMVEKIFPSSEERPFHGSLFFSFLDKKRPIHYRLIRLGEIIEKTQRIGLQ